MKYDYYEIYLQQQTEYLENDNYSIILKRPKGSKFPSKRFVTAFLKRKNRLIDGYKVMWISTYEDSQCEFDKRGALLYV